MRIRTVAVVAACIVALAGCSGDATAPGTGSGDAIAAKLIAAVDATSAAGSSRVAMVAQLDSAATEFSMTGAGLFDYNERLGSMTLLLSGTDVPVSAAGYEVLLVDPDIYVKLPPELADFLPKPWLRMTPAELAELIGSDVPGLASLGSQDPTSALLLLGGAEDIAEEGVETVRGDRATRYRFTVDLRAALEGFPEDARAGLEQLAASAAAIPMQAWVDGDGRVRRVKFVVDLEDFGELVGETAAGTISISMDFYDFGVPVSVEAPPVEDVAVYSELISPEG